MPILLDGERLALERMPDIAARSARVHRLRGQPPTLVLIAFESRAGFVPHVARKRAACAAAGIRLRARRLAADAPASALAAEIDAAVVDGACDAIFVQFPLSPAVDPATAFDTIPAELDIDLLSPAAFEAFVSGRLEDAPLTVAAGLALLARYGIEIAGQTALVIGPDSPLATGFAVALHRASARVHERTTVEDPQARARVHEASLVIALEGRPAAVPVAWLRDGAVAIDAGYFNPGGRGDIDLSTGPDHLRALAPVPGGIGPMTISMLLERTVSFAERRL